MSNSSSGKYTLDKVSQEMLSEAAVELESGRKEALEQLQAAVKEAKGEMARIVEGGERQAESLRRQILGSAELEARNRVLRTLEEATNRVFQDAMKGVSAASPPQYEKSLEKLISEGVEVLGDDAVVACNSKDRKQVSSILKELNGRNRGRLTLEEESIETAGGVILHSKDRSIRFDNTFEARLERLRPQLRREVVAVLSGSR